MPDKTTIIKGLKNEGSILKEAAKNVATNPLSAGTKIKDFGVAFKQGTTTNKLTVLSGGLTGLTITLSGIRSMRDGFRKDENGDRKWNDVAIGATQVTGGLVMAALFVERLKITSDDAGIVNLLNDECDNKHDDHHHHPRINSSDDQGHSR